MTNEAESGPSIDRLEEEYTHALIVAERFAVELTRPVQELLEANLILLSFPIQRRIKTWDSLREKLDRKALALKSLRDLDDLVGLRLILQFKRDVSKVCGLIEQHFKVLKKYDTSERLDSDQFGYSSIHFVLELPDSWLAVPTLNQLKGWHAEVQVRTTAQHIWAAASHTLQYKQEGSVPVLLRRGIHRVSALLEMIDLEFERLLEQRDLYGNEIGQGAPDTTLNVDLLENLLDALLPPRNKEDGEQYSELLQDLVHWEIVDRKGLTEVIKDHLPAVLIEDEKRAQEELEELKKKPSKISATEVARLSQGAYFTHTGLARMCLRKKFGAPFDRWRHSRRATSGVRRARSDKPT